MQQVSPNPSATESNYDEKSRNFWAYYTLILILINAAFLIPAFLQSNTLGLVGIPVIINGFLLIPGLLFGIIVLIWPIRILKILVNIVASIVFIPVILVHLFFHVGVPILATQHQNNIVQQVSDINGKTFAPVAFHDNDVLLPGNIIIRIVDFNTPKVICEFDALFQQEVMQKKELVTVSLTSNPYTITAVAGQNATESWLSQGQEYRLIEGNLKIQDQFIDNNWLQQNTPRSLVAQACI